MISKNIKLSKKTNYNSWDKVNLGSWKVNGDSQIYCELKVDVEKAEKYIKKLNEDNECKITITHFVGRVLGLIMKDTPDLNVLVKLGRIYYRNEVNIFFHVADEGDLSGYCLKNIDEKSLITISKELRQAAQSIRAKKDPSFKKIKSSWKIIPVECSKMILGFIRFITNTLNLNIRALGIPKDPFGGLMITNIGSLGFDSAFAPLPPYSEVPFLIALGKSRFNPVCDDNGKIEAKKQISLCMTIDHRIIDGYRGSIIVEKIKNYFDNPELI